MGRGRIGRDGLVMTQDVDAERVYAGLRGRAAAKFGEARAAELEEFLRATARQIAEVEQAGVDVDAEPLHQG